MGKCCTFTYTCIYTHKHTYIPSVEERKENAHKMGMAVHLHINSYTHKHTYTHTHIPYLFGPVEEQKENAHKMGMGDEGAVHSRVHAYTHTSTHTYHQLKSGKKLHTKWAWVMKALYIYHNYSK